MDVVGEYVRIPLEEYNELKAAKTEKNKLLREIRTLSRRNDILRLSFDTQSGLNRIINAEKLKQELYVNLLLEACPEIIVIIDENLRWLLSTRSINKIVDVNDLSLLFGQELDIIIERYRPPAFSPEITGLIREMIKSRGEFRIDRALAVSTAHNKYEVNLLPFDKDNGEFAGVLVIMHDNTDIVLAKEVAEQASMAKGDFLSRMSHEMRTPMNAVIGMTNIAKSACDQERINYCLDKIEVASKHLLGVINDILDMSKIEANKFELSPTSFDFEKTLISINNVISYRMEEKKQSFAVNLDAQIPEMIIGDELRLMQVITNLLSNSVKFTPEGGKIELNTKCLPTVGTAGKPILQIEVADNGIGISAEQQARLFTSFEQAEGGTARKYGGTGLGLAISKRIVELMGGRIWIESELGHGSRFVFTMEYEIGEKKPQPRLILKKEDVHILAVDDAPEIREFFVNIMNRFNLPCDVAASGFEALEMVRRCADKPYNIFFIDWLMPNMDGIELTRKIKEFASKNTVIFMISVAEWSDIERDAVDAGVERFISKPLFPSIILDNIVQCVEITDEGARKEAADFKGVRDFKGCTILIAEDIEINREIVAAVLEGTGIAIDFAENGYEAVNLFMHNPDRYSLVLMDIQMPEMDGYTATRVIRSSAAPQAREIPIIAMTANVFREDVDRCFEAGMDGHIGKPLDFKEVLNVMDKYVRNP